jgi:hypothetical protein
MKLKLLLPLYLLLIILNSCQKEIVSEQGGIDLISNVYFDASKGLDQMESFHLSKINYSQNQMIELVPDTMFPEINKKLFYIEDSLYCQINEAQNNFIFSDISKKENPLLVWDKKEGAVFSKDWILNYRNRRNLSDTVLFKKKYKRFEINSPGIILVFIFIQQILFCHTPFTDTLKKIITEGWNALILIIRRMTFL